MIPEPCRVCDDTAWVCENHPDRPWDGCSARDDACGCGPGVPCGACNLEMASDRFVYAALAEAGLSDAEAAALRRAMQRGSPE